MNQKRKRLGLWILFLAALLLTQFTVPVKASEPQIQDVNIQMVGGQIRTIDPMGLRMVACIKKSYIQELEKSGATVSYGIVLLPKKYLTEGQALTLDGKYLYNGSVYKPAKVPAVKKFSEDNDRIYFTAVLANLPKERYKNDYAARAYAEITRTVTEDGGKKKTTTEVVYSESEIDRQVYRIAEEAVNGTTETEETKQWLQDNILAPVDTPEELPEEEKKISFRLGKVSGVTLYHKTTSEAGVETVEEVSQFNLTEFKKEDYLVKVEMEDQPEIFAGITEVIAPQTETGKVSFKLDRKDYTTSQAGQTIEGAVVEFGTKSNDKVSTKYITMQSLIDQMKANPGGTYTLEHDIDASMVQGDDYLVPTFSGTFNGNGYKIKGLTTTLFGTVSGGKVQNVKLENVSITKVKHNDFDRTRQAISFGVDEYLLKPVKKVQIAKALQMIEDKLAGELVIETALSVENIFMACLNGQIHRDEIVDGITHEKYGFTLADRGNLFVVWLGNGYMEQREMTQKILEKLGQNQEFSVCVLPIDEWHLFTVIIYGPEKKQYGILFSKMR